MPASRGIYQYNRGLKIVAVHKTLEAASIALNIPVRTISAAVIRGSLCRRCWYFSREMGFVPKEPLKGEVAGRRFAVTVTDGIWDRMLVAIGQRKKQDIFRNLLLEWLENEERKHDRQDN